MGKIGTQINICLSKIQFWYFIIDFARNELAEKSLSKFQIIMKNCTIFFSGLLKVAELLRVKGLVEGESDKLLNSHLGKNGRPLVTTSMTDPPTSSSKLNGGSGGDSSRQTGNNNGDDRRSTSDSNKDSPNGGMRFMLPSQAGMPQLPMPFLPGMFPNLLGMCISGLR